MTQQNQYTWGFMLENTLFVEFDQTNNIIIENSYQQKKMKQSSHHIVIRDSHLPCDAKVYFGVAQIHLRMPGTRYYVKRKSLPVTNATTMSPTPVVASNQNTTNFQLHPHQHHPYQKQQQKRNRSQNQYNPRRRHSQVTQPLTRRSSSNNLYMASSQLPMPSASVSLIYPPSASPSTSTSSTLSTSLSPSSSTMVPFSPPMVLSNTNHLPDVSLAPSYSSPTIIENVSTSLQPNNETSFITDDAFSNLWNSTWLDSLYAPSSTSSMQALLIPWSTTPPPSSSNMFNHQVL